MRGLNVSSQQSPKQELLSNTFPVTWTLWLSLYPASSLVTCNQVSTIGKWLNNKKQTQRPRRTATLVVFCILCDTSTGRPPPPWSLEPPGELWLTSYTSLTSVHSIHKLVKQKCVRNMMTGDIKGWIKACPQCQACKVQGHTKTPMDNIPVPTRWHRWTPSLSNEMRYLFTVTDRSMSWLEATPMPDATTTTCVLALLHHWVSRFGIPEHMMSDRGA